MTTMNQWNYLYETSSVLGNTGACDVHSFSNVVSFKCLFMIFFCWRPLFRLALLRATWAASDTSFCGCILWLLAGIHRNHMSNCFSSAQNMLISPSASRRQHNKHRNEFSYTGRLNMNRAQREWRWEWFLPSSWNGRLASLFWMGIISRNNEQCAVYSRLSWRLSAADVGHLVCLAAYGLIKD